MASIVSYISYRPGEICVSLARGLLISIRAVDIGFLIGIAEHTPTVLGHHLSLIRRGARWVPFAAKSLRYESVFCYILNDRVSE